MIDSSTNKVEYLWIYSVPVQVKVCLPRLGPPLPGKLRSKILFSNLSESWRRMSRAYPSQPRFIPRIPAGSSSCSKVGARLALTVHFLRISAELERFSPHAHAHERFPHSASVRTKRTSESFAGAYCQMGLQGARAVSASRILQVGTMEQK